MPIVTIVMQKGKSGEYKKSLLEAVHQALVMAFKIPDHDRNQRIIEIDPENFEYEEGKSENFLTIEMTVFPGRSLQAKKALYKEIATRLETLGVNSSDILITLDEPPLENWGIRGGYPASEVDIGFKLDV
ncbi:MAG: tautomerase family protein [Desulfobacteraceae bacterium]|nr:tautomerase family protein [Desulfobacteraceae bacterium]